MITGVETAGMLSSSSAPPTGIRLLIDKVTGLIVAAFPILVSALEHYNEGLKPLKNFVRYQQFIKDLVLDLGTQRAMFQNTLE